MKTLINRVLRAIAFWRYALPALAKIVVGRRFFVFRDTPTWVLWDILEGLDPMEPDADVQEMYQQALDELKLRKKHDKI